MRVLSEQVIQLDFGARNKDSKVVEFDHVCDGNTTQADFFEKVGLRQMIQHVTKGYHGTVFAYGQTGAGKTYTVEGYKYNHNEKGKYVPQV